MVATYQGLTWWDNESDGSKMYPATQHNPSQDEEQEKLDRNPEAASMRGLWSNFDFLKDTGTSAFNALLKNTQFADSHGHGWMFRKVFKRDRKGNLLDAQGNIVSPDDPPEVQQGRSSQRHSSRKRDALRRLSLPAGLARRRQSLQRAARGDRDRVRRLSWDDQAKGDAVYVRARRRSCHRHGSRTSQVTESTTGGSGSDAHSRSRS